MNEQDNGHAAVRVAVGVEYDGTDYCGWQRQSHSPSVQAPLEAALSSVADHEVTVHCAGRTDTGVHAHEQVVHFDTTAKRSERSWVLGSNTRLPNDIAVLWAREVPVDFHARFAAVARTYRYSIYNRWVRPALWARQTAWVLQPLDAERMHLAAQCLVGEHDFSSFRAAGCQARQPVRCVDAISVYRSGELVVIEVTANGFLHHMVRNIAGSLIAIGRGDQSVSWMTQVLEARQRRFAGVTAPASGLVFWQAHYPDIFELPRQDGHSLDHMVSSTREGLRPDPDRRR
jgi:tRNA pseudouridine38-40 synthase